MNRVRTRVEGSIGSLDWRIGGCFWQWGSYIRRLCVDFVSIRRMIELHGVGVGSSSTLWSWCWFELSFVELDLSWAVEIGISLCSGFCGGCHGPRSQELEGIWDKQVEFDCSWLLADALDFLV
ncbi:hypothetical protein Droror1_Dr00015320 [Drosera rotundifolia]